MLSFQSQNTNTHLFLTFLSKFFLSIWRFSTLKSFLFNWFLSKWNFYINWIFQKMHGLHIFFRLKILLVKIMKLVHTCIMWHFLKSAFPKAPFLTSFCIDYNKNVSLLCHLNSILYQWWYHAKFLQSLLLKSLAKLWPYFSRAYYLQWLR